MSTLNPEKKMYSDKMLAIAGVPPRYLNHSFSNFSASGSTLKALEVAREWAELKTPKDRGFMLLGDPGVGKTHLAVAALRQLAGLWSEERNKEVDPDAYVDLSAAVERKMRFVNAPILLDGLRESIRVSDHPAHDLYKYCLKSASVVVIDDFGKEKATDWASERLYVLIESRYQNLLSTIVTSNRTLDELDDLGYGAAVSRLQETGRSVRIDGKDKRPELGAKSR